MPTIQYVSKFLIYENIIIDDLQRFKKQTYRNRACIAGANGIRTLVVPVKKGKSKMPVGEVMTGNEENWQRNHWASIRSAYGKAPFFIHYAEYFQAVYRRHFERLIDFDLRLMELCLSILKLTGKYVLHSSLEGGLSGSNVEGENEVLDFRSAIHPKKRYRKPDPGFKPVAYSQVFMERFGFIPNLSIIDLLFNEGPYAINILRNCVRKAD